jgi:PhnB protein
MNAPTTTMSSTKVQPYLFFGGRCEEALTFYQSALGAKIEMVMRHKDSACQPPAGTLPPGYEDKIMHSSFRVGETEIMASDGCGEASIPSGFSLSLSVPSTSMADRVFGALAEGGEVQMPLSETFFSPRFGMVKDRFGVGWMVMAEPPQ